MSNIMNAAFWSKRDEKDKYELEPEGAFFLSGNIEVGPVDVVFKAGTKVGFSVKRNRNKKDGAPDFRGEIFELKEREGGQ